jgi:hypothetical protein
MIGGAGHNDIFGADSEPLWNRVKAMIFATRRMKWGGIPLYTYQQVEIR